MSAPFGTYCLLKSPLTRRSLKCASETRCVCAVYNVSKSVLLKVICGCGVACSLPLQNPCPPNNVGTHVACGGTAATVTWETSAGALGYVATLDGRDGHSLSCHMEATFCTVGDVHCGTVYYVTVVALGAELNSSDSAAAVMDSGSGPHTPVTQHVLVHGSQRVNVENKTK